MCGITGLINFNKKRINEKELWDMTDALSHRGPDDRGIYIDNFIGLGHRRLSIIDLSSLAHQPMQSANGDFMITYNGEVYNFRELRKELENEGVEFKSRSDTEVVLKSFMKWGINSVNRFNGMFAFAVWDKQKQELFLARDRYGIKPLYYSFQNDIFLFGSEQKAILTHPTVKREIDLEAMLEYFTFQNIFTDRTLVKGIKLFPAGCWVKIQLRARRNQIDPVRYWDYEFREVSQPRKEKDYIEELDRLFRQAVRRQLVSDVPLGSYLSGGMDSGAITAIAATQLPYIKTFTCGFDLHSVSGLEMGFDEREKAEFMSYLFKTEHYEMVLKAGDMERILPTLSWCLEEPRVGQSYPNYYAAQLASKFVKVVLSGVGGDELFGGYPWRYYRFALNDDFEHYIDKYYIFWQRLIDNKYIQEIFKPIWNRVKGVRTRDIFHDVFKKHKHNLKRSEDYINHSLYFEAKTFLHGLLIVEDKLSMAHSLETRVPFLDNDLVDFAMQVPARLKLRNLTKVTRLDENEIKKYFQKTSDGKVLLRKMMKRYIPAELTRATKQGFSAPDASWFKGESIEYVRQVLFKDHARIYGFMDKKTVQGLINEHLKGKLNLRLFIWSLLNMEWWLKRFMV